MDKVTKPASQRSTGIIRIILACMLVMLLVPLMGTTTQTADAAVGMQNGVGPIEVNKSTATTVAFGGKEWVVVGGESSGIATGSTNRATLLLKDGQSYTFSDTRFDHTEATYWSSIINSNMNSIYDGLESTGEQPYVVARTLPASIAANSSASFDFDTIYGITPVVAHFWPLSTNEAYNQLNASLRTFNSYNWWLRSPGYDLGFAGVVLSSGDVYPFGYSVVGPSGVRPAFRLDLSSVLFTSSASGASAKPAGIDNLSQVATPTGTIKFTMEDVSQTLGVNATTAQSTQSDVSSIELSYEGATTGSGQWVSCYLKNQNTTNDYYAKRVDTSTSSSGTLSIPLTGVADGTYTVKLFSEQANGETYTDFASAPVEFEINVMGGSATITDIGDIDVLSDDAGLTSVAGQAITTTGGSGTAVDPLKANISVASSVDQILDTEIITSDLSATATLYSDSDFSTAVNSVTLSAGEPTTLYIKVVAEDSTECYYAVTATRSPVLVTSVTVTGASDITTKGGTVQLGATIAPADATDHTVTWSIESGSAVATIDQTGKVTAKADGTVTVRATANDASGVYDEATITVSNQTDPVPSDPDSWFERSDTYTKKTNVSLVFVADKDFVLYDSAKVDGTTVSSPSIEVTQSSTKATLVPAYLDTLSVGAHTIELVFTDGTSASGTFQIKAAVPVDTDKGTVAKTGDGSPILLLTLIALVGALVVFAVPRLRNNRKVTGSRHRR